MLNTQNVISVGSVGQPHTLKKALGLDLPLQWAACCFYSSAKYDRSPSLPPNLLPNFLSPTIGLYFTHHTQLMLKKSFSTERYLLALKNNDNIQKFSFMSPYQETELICICLHGILVLFQAHSVVNEFLQLFSCTYLSQLPCFCVTPLPPTHSPILLFLSKAHHLHLM